MKIVLAALSIICCASFFSQTAIISAKSHSASVPGLRDTDRFGEMIEIIFDTVILLPNKCVIEISNWAKDTICDHPYIKQKRSLEEIKTFYSLRTVFIGFDSYEPPPHLKKDKHHRENNLTYLFILAIGLTCIFSLKKILIPMKIKKNKH